jgi:predicted Zn-dependent protease
LRILPISVILCVSALGAAEPNGIDTALQRMYNQDYVAAHQILDGYIATRPQDPLPYAFRASAYLFYELDRLGVLESEFLTDDKQIAEKKKKLDPDPVNREKFVRAVHDVETRADAALKLNPNDPQALFAMCIAQGVATDYMAFVEKKQFASLSVAKRSNGYAQRLLKLDPKFYDAYLTAGISEYMIGSLPFFVKWFVHFDNVAGSKDQGVDRLKLVAREGHYFKPFSKIMLSIISLREKRPQEAQQWLTELARDYPENRLFRKELAKVNAKLGVNAN